MAAKWFIDDIERELGVKASTWRAYVSRGQAPKAAGRVIVGTVARPWWRPRDVLAWYAGRPGSGRWGSRAAR